LLEVKSLTLEVPKKGINKELRSQRDVAQNTRHFSNLTVGA
jgi:hypothetical protein